MDKKIEKAISKLLQMYEKIENDLLIEIASHFSINDEFLNSDYWRIKKLEEMGLFNQDIIKYLSKATKKTPQEVKQALNQIGIDTINLNNLNKLFEDEVLKINPNTLVNNYTVNSIINSSYDELNNRIIQMSSKIEKGAREAYLNIVESVYLKTSMGTHSYQEAIKEAINDLSNKGIKTLSYRTMDEGGNIVGIRNYDIEGAVRREVLTASRQLNNDIAMETANELDCKYLYLSEHLECRPTHFDWQGTIIKRDELIDITHYGEVDGLGGINCRHYFEPYFGDARGSELKEYSKEQCKSAYDNSQHQRYLERGIRKWKRKAEMFKSAEDNDAYDKCRGKVREWQSRISDFVSDNNIERDVNREYVSGFRGKASRKLSARIIDNLKELNITADQSLSKIDHKLLNININQITKLSKKYSMEDFFYSMNTSYWCLNKSSVASVGYNDEMTQIYINSSYKYFQNNQNMINEISQNIKDNWCMPCDEDKYDIYAMTHEFGHALEIKMFKQKLPFGDKLDYYSFSNSVKNDIIQIAVKNNPNFDLAKNISGYGIKKNSREFFAECFANMELGKENELGKALRDYLKERNIL